MNKDELLEISKNFFGSVFQVENVSEKIRNLTYREVKKVFSAHDPRDLDCIIYPYEVLFTLIFLAILRGSKRQALFLIKPENFLPVSNHPLTY
jgi:hypothetical protein